MEVSVLKLYNEKCGDVFCVFYLIWFLGFSQRKIIDFFKIQKCKEVKDRCGWSHQGALF